MEITSLDNPRLKNILKLKKASERKRQKRLIIEGWRELTLAANGGAKVEELFYCPDFAKNKILPIDLPKTAIFKLAKKAFAKISYRENPDGFLAIAKIENLLLENLQVGCNPLIIILAGVEKPGNLGAILRTADAAGLEAVIINDPKVDLYNPNVIRASQGTIFTVPTIFASASQTISWCRQHKIKIFSTTPKAKKLYTEINFKSASAIVLGSEDKGLSQRWLDLADEQIKIPMKGRIDSLNVSVAAAIILFEAVRQRESQK